jgi:hypothetical protein
MNLLLYMDDALFVTIRECYKIILEYRDMYDE